MPGEPSWARGSVRARAALGIAGSGARGRARLLWRACKQRPPSSAPFAPAWPHPAPERPPPTSCTHQKSSPARTSHKLRMFVPQCMIGRTSSKVHIKQVLVIKWPSEPTDTSFLGAKHPMAACRPQTARKMSHKGAGKVIPCLAGMPCIPHALMTERQGSCTRESESL